MIQALGEFQQPETEKPFENRRVEWSLTKTGSLPSIVLRVSHGPQRFIRLYGPSVDGQRTHPSLVEKKKGISLADVDEFEQTSI